MRTALATLGLLALAACETRPAEDPTSWYDPGQPKLVTEPIAFTDVPYDLPAAGELGIADLKDAVFPVSQFGVPLFGADDQYPERSLCDSNSSTELPFEIEGVVTLHPRYYFKTRGCDGDEKYYGSYFIEDATGGVFVLGDSKVAHFGMGDRVKLRVRGVLTSFDVDMVYAHDVLAIERSAEPLYYEELSAPPSIATHRDAIGRVHRVEGVVVTEKDTFGSFQIESDAGDRYTIQLDVELTRRGTEYAIGERIRATGPLFYSYSTFSIVVMRLGQVERL